MNRSAVYFAACLFLVPTFWPAGAAAQQTMTSAHKLQVAMPPDLVIEAESLLSVAKASAGEISRQDMNGFGDGWGGGAQLFWRSPESPACLPSSSPLPKIPGVTDCTRLSFWIPVDKPAWYRIAASVTAAPDYGDVQMRINGEAGPAYTGYSKGVSWRRLEPGEFFLPAGSTLIELEVTGKSGDSTGYFVGLDRLELWRLPPRTGSASRPAGSMQAGIGAVQLAGKPLGCELRKEGCGWSGCSAGIIAINTTGSALPAGTIVRYQVNYTTAVQSGVLGGNGETKTNGGLPPGAELRVGGVAWSKSSGPGGLSCSANALVMPPSTPGSKQQGPPT